MTLLGLDALTFGLVVILMVACAGGISRLLWLLDGSPPLDRPALWPGAKAGEEVSGRGSTPVRRATAGACAVCCGAPLLLLASVVALGVATTVGVAAGLLVAGGAIVWGLHTGRIKRVWQRGRKRVGTDSCNQTLPRR